MKISRSRTGRVGRNRPTSRSIYWGLWNPTAMFKFGEQGLWYDPSDLTDAKLAFRRNLFTWSSDFTMPVWSKTGTTVAMQADGSNLLSVSANSAGLVGQNTGPYIGAPVGTAFSAQIKAKAGSTPLYGIRVSGVYPNRVDVVADLTAGTIVYAAGSTYTLTSSSITGPDASGLFTIALSGVVVGTAIGAVYHAPAHTASAGWEGATASALSAYSKDAQIELSATPSAFQKITDFSAEFMAAFPQHTLFQDNLGATPVTAFEQGNGLLGDKRFGGVRGTEMLSALSAGGPFTSVGNWTTTSGNSSLAVVNGEIAVTTVGTGSTWSARVPGIVLTAGIAYEFMVTLRASDVLFAGGVKMSLYNETASSSAYGAGALPSLSNTTFRVIFTPTTNMNVSLIVDRSTANSADNGKIIYIVSASVKPFIGSHASQATTTARPLLSARVNKCLNYNANPTDLTGVTFTNATNGLATATIVDDTAALAAAGLSGQATSGKVYRIDNSVGNSSAYLVASGSVGNVSPHTVSAYGRLISGSLVRVELQGGAGGTTSANAAYTKISTTVTPDTTARGLVMLVPAGAVGHFILNQLEEGNTPAARVQTTTGSTYDATGWPRYLSFDGVDDNLLLTNLDLLRNTPSAFLSLAAYSPPTGASGRLFAAGSDRFLFYKGATDNISMGARGPDADAAVYGGVGAALAASEQFSLLAAYARGTVQTRRNRGGTIANTAMTSAANTSDTASAAIRVGANANGASEFVRGRLYNMLLLCTREPSTAEITKTENAMEAKRLAA